MEVTGERFIPGYPGEWIPEHYHRYFLACGLVEGKRVLDIASGEGYGSAILAQHASHVTGVDISQETVDAARNKYQKDNLEYLCGSVTAIPLADHSVDVVVSFETIEHLAEHVEMLAEIRRVLTPEGLLIISTPDKLIYSDIPNYKNEFHVKELYEEEFVALLKQFFSEICLYRQKLEYGSLVSSETACEFLYMEQQDNTFSSRHGLQDGKYIIALAGMNSLPNIPSSLLKYPIEISATFCEQRHLWEEEKCKNHEANEHIARLMASLEEEKCKNYEAHASIAQLEASLAEVTAQKEYFSTQFNMILQSRSWKLTEPLRALFRYTGGKR